MKKTLILALCGFASLTLAALPLYTPKGASKPMSNAKATIVLVHGAFADANSWSKIIVPLEKDGYNVVAVQNPLSSLEDDAVTTRRVIDAQKGPVIVVGHSYGGAVMTKAATGAENVKALVYVAAFGPDEGEVIGALLEQYPTVLGTSLAPDAAGYLYIARDKFKEAFAADVVESERIVMETTQRPINGAIFGAKFTAPAWKTIPSWYMVAQEDHAINPELERMFAKRMKAKTVEIKSSHVPMISHPQEVIKLIKEAASATVK